MKNIRFAVVSMILAIFAIASVASAQVTSINHGNNPNEAYATIGTRGVTLDRVEFTIPNKFVTQTDGLFRPGAMIQMNVPVTNTRSRDMTCGIFYHHLNSDYAQRARRIADWVSASSGVNVPAGSTATLQYSFQFKPATEWGPNDWNERADWDVKVICQSTPPAVSPNTSH